MTIAIKFTLTRSGECSDWPIFFDFSRIHYELFRLGVKTYFPKNYVNPIYHRDDKQPLQMLYLLNSVDLLDSGIENIMKHVPPYKTYFTEEEYHEYNRVNGINIDIEIIENIDLLNYTFFTYL
jgi:hypothetical protein